MYCFQEAAASCDLNLAVYSVVSTGPGKSPKSRTPKTGKKSPPKAAKPHLPYECKVCDESFDAESQLTEHLYAHIESAPKLDSIELNSVIAVKLFDCSWCHMQFGTPAELTDHLIQHGDRRPHVCDCGRRMATAEKLAQHRMTHSKDGPRGRRTVAGEMHECTQCGKQFATSRQLGQHVQTHSDQRPYQCLQVGNHTVLCEQCFFHFKLNQIEN